MSLKDNIKTGAIQSGKIKPAKTNAPKQYAGRQKQYFGTETSIFVSKYAKYSSDFCKANVQGLNPDDSFEWREELIRMADISPDSASTIRKQDDYKSVLFANKNIDYIRPGSKIEVMGNTWLVTNPQNMSSATATTVVQRCNTSFGYFDFYGNPLLEPVCIDKELALSNNSDFQHYALITEGYYNIRAQYNDVTRQIDTNTRLILGSGAYRVTGYGDFIQEFSGEKDSVRLLEFTARYEVPNDDTDDLEHWIAGGKNRTFELAVSGGNKLAVGQSTALLAAFVRDGVTVEPSEENPVTFKWESADESIATVDKAGVVTAESNGETEIICTLEQNHNLEYRFSVSVEVGKNTVEFTSYVPDVLRQYDSISITAAYFADGVETDEPVSFALSGADSKSYKYEIIGNSIEIECYRVSDIPLAIMVSHGELDKRTEIQLIGI